MANSMGILFPLAVSHTTSIAGLDWFRLSLRVPKLRKQTPGQPHFLVPKHVRLPQHDVSPTMAPTPPRATALDPGKGAAIQRKKRVAL